MSISDRVNSDYELRLIQEEILEVEKRIKILELLKDNNMSDSGENIKAFSSLEYSELHLKAFTDKVVVELKDRVLNSSIEKTELFGKSVSKKNILYDELSIVLPNLRDIKRAMEIDQNYNMTQMNIAQKALEKVAIGIIGTLIEIFEDILK